MYCCRIADHGPQARASWAFGKAGNVGDAVSIASNIVSLRNGDIGAGRFAYRTTGTVASMVGSGVVGGEVGGPWGALAGLGIGLGFSAGEQAYDGYTYWHTQMSIWLTNFENGIKSGWVPGR